MAPAARLASERSVSLSSPTIESPSSLAAISSASETNAKAPCGRRSAFSSAFMPSFVFSRPRRADSLSETATVPRHF